MPKISVITVCFNSADTIEQTIKSVVGQEYDDYEYIIVDGASTDGTVDIIKRYAGEYPDKIRYVSEPDTGIYNAMNKGVKMAEGEVIALLNSSDWYADGVLRTVEKYMIPDKYYVIYGEVLELKDEKPYTVQMGGHDFIPEHTLVHPACFVSRGVYEDMGGYDEKYRSAADYDFFLRIFRTGKVRFIPVYVLMTYFRLGGMSSGIITEFENNDIRYSHGCISRRVYRITKLKLFLVKIYRKMISRG